MTHRRRTGPVLSGAVVALLVAFVVANLRPGLWFVDTTPTGGDLGAHVWAPAYLRDVLIPEFRLTGWTHDWYAGFPAFTFYMVIPSLLVVIVDAGLGLSVGLFAWLAVVSAACAVALAVVGRTKWPAAQRWAVALGIAGVAGAAKLFVDDVAANRALAALLLPAVAAGWAWHGLRARPRWRAPAAVTAAMLALLVVPMPYGVSLKLVAIAGVVALPVAVWAMARSAGVGPEGQALAAAATLLFLFDLSFNIYGGNLMSTMAGEFAYSLGLAVAVLYIGAAARGMDSGRHRVLAGSLLALTGLLHLFSAFLALGATAALVLTGRWRRAAWLQRLRWTLVTGALGALLSAWWVLPFWWNRGLLNDMGWGKERRYLSSLWSRSSFDHSFLVNDPPLQLFVVVAAAGAALLFFRWSRLHAALALTGVIFAVAFVVMPEGRLWNVRILPFYYLTVYLTAALGLGEAIGWGRSWIDRRPAARVEAGAGRLRASAGAVSAGVCVGLAVVAVLITVGLPMRSLPGGRTGGDGVYRWGPVSSGNSNLGPYWVQYNFEGYERRQPTADGGGSTEYWDLVDTMGGLGESRGCGPSLWEYGSGRLGSYGTPMAPMLLPYWTDRCIGSMEGLYFEASATTPYHFLMQSELSAAPSRAQRDLPYGGLDVARGTEHMRAMGVRYYMAFSDEAVVQARRRGRPGGGGGLGPVGRVRGGRQRAGNRPGQAAGGGGRSRRLQRRLAGGVGGSVPGRGPGRAAAGRRRPRGLAPHDAAGHAPWIEGRRRRRNRPGRRPAAGDAAAGRGAARLGAPHRRRAGGGERRGPQRPLDLVLGRPHRVAGAGAHVVLPQLVGVGRGGSLPGDAQLHGGGAHQHRGAPQLRAQPGGVDRARDHARRPGRRRVAHGAAERVRHAVRLSVVVPAYREAGRIGATVAALRAALAPVHEEGGAEIVVVDDGSDDGTAAAGRAAGADMVVEFPVNRGKGAAVRAGMRAASGAVVAFTDADLSYPPHQLLALLEEVEQGADAAVGDRCHPDSVVLTEPSRLRRAGSRAVGAVCRMLRLGRGHDTQCGLKAFSREAAGELLDASVVNRFAFDVELLFLADRLGMRVRDVQVEVVNRRSSSVRVVSDGWELVLDMVRIRCRAFLGRYPATK